MGWDGMAADAWLAGFFASPQGVNKVVKLRSVTMAAERHLGSCLTLEARQGWPLACATVVMHCQRRSPQSAWPGLRWARGTGWVAFG